MIIHIPHSSFEIPAKYRDQFLLSDSDIQAEQLRMTDAYTDVLFDAGFHTIVFPISRLICDVERFRNDADEIMAGRGMGVIYTSACDGRPLKKVTEPMKNEILRDYYDVHHQRLERCAWQCLETDGSCLIVDAHSFTSKPLPYEINQSNDRPDYCIGADDYHTPKKLVDTVRAFLENEGYSVNINHPFSGSMVPFAFYKKNPGVMSVMIEINRKLYMNEKTGQINSGFSNTRDVIRKVLEFINGQHFH